MLKQLYTLLGEYRRDALLAPFLIFGEVLMELFIPYVMAGLIDQGVLGGGGISYTVKMGGLMILMALAALIFGALAGRLASRACTGLAANLRTALFDKVMDFSFSNVDHFSSASLITRLTSDVTNVQNAFLMILRMGLRAPILLAGAASMAVLISRRLSLIFLAALPILAAAIITMMKNGYPRFQQMLRRVDAMNASVQENLTGIRVVKAYVREEHETEKFTENAEALRKAQFFAERLILLTLPILQLTISGCIVAVVWFGGNLVIAGGLELGQLSAFLSYVSQILMSLMFLSMIFLLCVLSRASVTRIQEVLAETPSIQDILGPSSELTDGSIEFIDASFSYGGPGDNLTLEHISLSIRSGDHLHHRHPLRVHQRVGEHKGGRGHDADRGSGKQYPKSSDCSFACIRDWKAEHLYPFFHHRHHRVVPAGPYRTQRGAPNSQQRVCSGRTLHGRQLP